jgi:hypothetical protein
MLRIGAAVARSGATSGTRVPASSFAVRHRDGEAFERHVERLARA